MLALFAISPSSRVEALIGPASAGVSQVPLASSCAGEIEAPVSIRLDDPEGVACRGELLLTGSIELHADAPRLVVRFETRGPLVVYAGPIELGPYFAGESVSFEVPATCTEHGDAVVHVWAEVTDELGAPLFSNRGSIYARLRPEGHLYGRAGFLSLERRAVETARESGKMSDEQALRELGELVRLSPIVSTSPPTARPFSPRERRLNELIGLPGKGAALAGEGVVTSGGDDSITIQGNVRWQDENGDWHPVWFGKIVAGSPGSSARTVTDIAGNYSAVLAGGPGGNDVVVNYVLQNEWITTRGPGFYRAETTYEDVPGGTVLNVSFSFEAGGADLVGHRANDANSVFQAATWIAAYAASDLVGYLSQLLVYWPSGEDGSSYDGTSVWIEEADRYDWDTIHHEYGHYVMDWFDISSSSGGPHHVGDCLVAVSGLPKDRGNRLAWGEGWPTYFGTTGQIEMEMASLGVPRVGDTSYEDLEDSAVSYSLESQDSLGRGEDNEIAVQRLLFDLYDSNDDSRDTISSSDNWIWTEMRTEDHWLRSLSLYWTNLRSGRSNRTQLQMGGIAADHEIGPTLDTPLDGALVTPSHRNFSWQRNVGCPESYEGDEFDLVFYDAETFDELLTVPGLTSSSYTLELAELQSLTAATHHVLWAVDGRNGLDGLLTGPYLGESFAVTVNQPPEADAGEDVTVECASPTATPAGLDGTASSDPDGDPLANTWIAAGVSFDDAGSSTPTGQFPVGDTEVTLVVSDTIQEHSDSVSVTVADSTPPEMSVAITPDALWPPNGKMRTMTAKITVYDTCDPDPDVTLMSIASGEGGQGHDDSSRDIAGAEYGEDDREFRLRARRSGTGPGRTYTIIYRATDAAGNHTDVATEVLVLHDRSR
jgi:hypothetical protein